jgi:hypothetical protein
MKFRHAAALALTGWYLMTPPLQANGHHDQAAPLEKWRIEAGFGTGDDCKKTLGVLSSRAAKEGKSRDIEAVKDAQCVSTDDPRIKEK